MRFVKTIENIWKIEDLRNRLITTLFFIAIYRFGSFVVLPGVDPVQLQLLQSNASSVLLGLLDMFSGSFKYEYDNNLYPPSNYIVLQLKYNDVYLSHFYKIKEYVEKLNSGDIMEFDEYGCIDNNGNRVVLFSKKFNEEMRKYIDMGYKPLAAKIKNILYWKQEDCSDETMIVLPHLEFIKDKQ